MERLRKYIELKINLTTVVTVIILIVSWAAGWGELRANHNALVAVIDRHIQGDDAKFAALATKETRAMRDQTVDSKFKDVEDKYQLLLSQIKNELAENNRRLGNLERMHMRQ